jgi:hypothetical protein
MLNTIPLLGFSERDATECKTRLSHYTGGASREHWMDLELCIRLATMTYKRPIVSYVSSMYSEVFFPCSLPISEYVDDPIGIFYDGVCHFQMVDLANISPDLLGLPPFHYEIEKKLIQQPEWRTEFINWYNQSSLGKWALNHWY